MVFSVGKMLAHQQNFWCDEEGMTFYLFVGKGEGRVTREGSNTDSSTTAIRYQLRRKR